MEVDQAYLISVDDLRQICKELTVEKFTYEVTECDAVEVFVRFNHGEDDLNATVYSFPIISNLWFPGENKEDGHIACLHVYTQHCHQKGLYPDGPEIKWDGLEDWQKFWTPLDALLYRKLTA